jgi:Periplasmic copper-binding protein (NosD)
MTRFTLAIAAVLACSLFAAPAQAQRSRVFVASYGSDSNPCTFGSPCKTFQHAHDTVTAGGEITAIDSAGFGPITINKAITITSPDGVEAGIVNGNGVAISINAGTTDLVRLRGLTLNGGGIGYAGVYLSSAGGLTIENCVIRDFTGAAGGGVDIFPNSGVVSVVITHSAFAHNSAGIYIYTLASVNMVVDQDVITDNPFGLDIVALNGGGTIVASISNSTVSNNTTKGTLIEGPVSVSISSSTISNNAIGIYADGTPSISIDNDTISNNGTGIHAQDTSKVVMGRSAITNNTAHGIDNQTAPNSFYTYQNNQINLNGDANNVNGNKPNDLTFQ